MRPMIEHVNYQTAEISRVLIPVGINIVQAL